MGPAPSTLSSNTSPTTYETGVKYEVTHLTWKIKNFRHIIEHDALINSEELHFFAGSRISLPSNWTLFLQCKQIPQSGRWVGFFYKVEDYSFHRELFSKLLVSIIDKDQNPVWSRTTKISNMCEYSKRRGWGYEQMIKGDADLKFLVDGSLVLQVQHVLYSRAAQIEYPTETKGIDPESNKDADDAEQSKKKIKLEDTKK